MDGGILVKFEVYCDESRPDLFASKRSPARYLVIGSLWLPASHREDFKAALHGLRDRFAVGGEFKWTKVSPSRLDFYQALVDWFFDRGEDLRFRCIAVDRDQVDLKLYHQNDQELGFYKFYYQLLHNWILDFNEYAIFVDFKWNRRRDRLHVLRRCLDAANLSSKVERVQALRSEESVLVQLADVFTGAVSRRLNPLSGTSPAKESTVSAIEGRLGYSIQATPRSEQKLNVFVIDLRGGW
jgi:hypothetical protein